MDRGISRKLKGKVLYSCVVPASTYGLETLALSELHQHKLQVCENNWIRIIAGVRRVERRRMNDLREKVGTKACIVGKIVKSRMKRAEHMVRMNDDKLPKRADPKKQEGSRKRGRPQLRWENCVKRDLRKAEEEEKWSEKANNQYCQQQGPMEANYESSAVTSISASPLHKGKQGKNNICYEALIEGCYVTRDVTSMVDGAPLFSKKYHQRALPKVGRANRNTSCSVFNAVTLTTIMS